MQSYLVLSEASANRIDAKEPETINAVLDVFVLKASALVQAQLHR
jgi:hypothetical protein